MLCHIIKIKKIDSPLKGQSRDLKNLYGGLDWVITRWFIINFHLRTPSLGEKCPFVGKKAFFGQVRTKLELGRNKI